jgi:hypothetical protein
LSNNLNVVDSKMVKKANTHEARAWGALPSRTEMGLRRISSVALMAGFLTVAHPFAPFGWLLPSDGPDVLDRFLAWPLLLGALFFQWRIAGVVGTLTIQIADFVAVYQHAMYWKVAGLEAVLIVAVNLGQHEVWRRFVASGLIAGLWGIGWACTPLRYKLEAWEHLKWIWTVLAIDEVRRGLGGRAGRGRRW